MFDRIVITTFAGYFFTQILCLRSIQQHAAGIPIDIIIDDFDIQHWPSYVEDCEAYIKSNFATADITFKKFSAFAGMDQVRTGGWFRQQLVKLYLDHWVDGHSWLVVDADVEFTEPPAVNSIGAVIRHEPTSIDFGNRMYVEYMLACDQPWVHTPDQYWCLSSVPFRLIHRDLLLQLRARVQDTHQQSLFDLHQSLFTQNRLVAYDPNNRTMIMSEFQLIELFRHRYYHTPLPIFPHSASKFKHSSLKDWQFERQWFEQQGVPVSDQHWNHSQLFGNRRA